MFRSTDLAAMMSSVDDATFLQVKYPGWAEQLDPDGPPGQPWPALAHEEMLPVSWISNDDTGALYVLNEHSGWIPLCSGDVIHTVDGQPDKIVNPIPVFFVFVGFQEELLLDYPDMRLGLPAPRTVVDERIEEWREANAHIKRLTNIEMVLSHHDRDWIAEHVAADPLVREVTIRRVPGQVIDVPEAIRRG